MNLARTSCLFLLAALLCLPTRAIAQGSEETEQPNVLGRWKFSEGEVFEYKVLKTRVGVIKVPDKAVGRDEVILNAEDKQEYRLRFQVKELREDGVAVLEMRYVWIKISNSREWKGRAAARGKNSMELDSADAVDFASRKTWPNAQAFAELDMPYRVEIAPTGQVLSTTGSKAVFDRVLGAYLDFMARKSGMKLSPNHPLIKASPAVSSLKDQYNDAATADFLREFLFKFPDEPVSRGSTWIRDAWRNDPSIGRLKERFTYTVAGLDDKQIKALVEARLFLKEGEEGADEDSGEDPQVLALRRELEKQRKAAGGTEEKTHISMSTNIQQVLFDRALGKVTSLQSNGKRKLRVDAAEGTQFQEQFLGMVVTLETGEGENSGAEKTTGDENGDEKDEDESAPAEK